MADELIDLQDKINQLLCRAEMFLDESKKLWILYNRVKKEVYFAPDTPEIYSLKILHVLYFNEVLLTLGTLFESNRSQGNAVEVSLKAYHELTIKNDIPEEINKMYQSYWTSPLPKFRSQLIAHKQLESSGDSLVVFLNVVEERWLDKADDLLKDMRMYVSKEFDVEINNTFSDLYKNGFSFLYESINSKMKLINNLT